MEAIAHSSTTTPRHPLQEARTARHGGTAYVAGADGVTGVVMVDGETLAAFGYRGRSLKPAFRYRFANAEARQAYVSRWIAAADAAHIATVARRAERRAPHSLTVGDVLYSSWGYEQTNIQFYEVVAVRGAAVDLMELKQDRSSTGNMTGTCTARKGDVTGALIKGKRPNGQNCVRLSSFETAAPWDGRALAWSSYA